MLSRRSSRWTIGAVAAVAAWATSASAEPERSSLGATSRASIQIRLSVAPHVGLRWQGQEGRLRRDVSRACLVTTRASRRMFVTLRPATSMDRSPDAGASIKAELHSNSSSANCPNGVALKDIAGSNAGRLLQEGGLLLVAQD